MEFHKGILLYIIDINANNGIYPITYDVVEGESKDSWLWFTSNLKGDLQIQDGKGYTIVSYEHLRIIESLKVSILLAEHKYYCWHILQNFIKVKRGSKISLMECFGGIKGYN